jgi:hypothetical protein
MDRADGDGSFADRAGHPLGCSPVVVLPLRIGRSRDNDRRAHSTHHRHLTGPRRRRHLRTQGRSSPTASSSHRRPAPGCGARTRTPTGSSASTSPRAAICAPTRSPICERSNSASTRALGSDSPGAAPALCWNSRWQGDPVSVATTTRIRRGTRPSRGGQFSGAVDNREPAQSVLGATRHRLGAPA